MQHFKRDNQHGRSSGQTQPRAGSASTPASQPCRTCRPTLPFRLCSSGWPSLSQAVVKRHMAAADGAGYKHCGKKRRAVAAGGPGGWRQRRDSGGRAACKRYCKAPDPDPIQQSAARQS